MKLCLIKARAIYEPGGYGGADGLLVREGRIARLGGYDALKRAYPEAETLDWSALYVLPALVNTHVHLEFDATAQARVHYIDETPALRALGAAKRANEALKSGVATLRDAGSDWTLLDLKTPRAAKRLRRWHRLSARTSSTTTSCASLSRKNSLAIASSISTRCSRRAISSRFTVRSTRKRAA